MRIVLEVLANMDSAELGEVCEDMEDWRELSDACCEESM